MTQIFNHKDYFLVAYLILNGCKVKDQKKINGVTRFFFERTDDLRKLVGEFYAGEAGVDAYEYSKRVRNLKQIINSNLSPDHGSALTSFYGEQTDVTPTEGYNK